MLLRTGGVAWVAPFIFCLFIWQEKHYHVTEALLQGGSWANFLRGRGSLKKLVRVPFNGDVIWYALVDTIKRQKNDYQASALAVPYS